MEGTTSRNTVTLQIPTADEIASKRTFAPISFGIVILLFLLPFFDIKCSGQKIASVRGTQLITGTNLNMGGGFDNGNLGTQKQSVNPNIWAIIALISAAGGGGFYIAKHKREALIGAVASGVGIISLTFLRMGALFTVNRMAENMITISFKPAYWVALLAFTVAGMISFFRLRLWETTATAIVDPDNTIEDLIT